MGRIRLVITGLVLVSGLSPSVYSSIQPYYPVPPRVNHTTYFEVWAGPYRRDVKGKTPLSSVFNDYPNQSNDSHKLISWQRGESGFSAGFSGGWRLTRHLALDGGWFWIQRQATRVENTGNNTSGSNYALKSWVFYGGVRVQRQVFSSTYLFAKLGMAYVNTRIDRFMANKPSDSPDTGSNRFDYWAPMAAIGVNFYLSDNWYGALQYLVYGAGGRDRYQNATDTTYVKKSYTGLRLPFTQMLMLGVGYQIEL